MLSLKQPPKWLRRPISASFGFGGLLASTSNLPGPSGKHQSGVVHLRSVVTEQAILDRATALQETSGDKDKMEGFCNEKVTGKSEAAWKTLQTIFKANSREELVHLLGFSKDEVARQVAEAIKKFPSLGEDGANGDQGAQVIESEEVAKETLVQASKGTTSWSSVPSENGQAESTGVGEQGVFEEDTPGTPAAAAADFFSSMGTGNLRNPQLDHVVPYKGDGVASSAVATIGSQASSFRSEAVKGGDTFRIYPPCESEVDRLITQSLVVGDFTSAVNLCLASERFADALILAVRGGPKLLQSTQKAYFARHTTSLPFLRIFQSIVMEDLTDIVQNADLNEWKVIFVVLCTFAKESDFGHLAEQLGQRLQYKAQMLAGSDSPEAKTSAKTAKEDATLCFLAARRLEKVVGIWIEEMGEEEIGAETTRYTAHVQALQSFIEKVTVFTAAASYVDDDLIFPTESAVAAEAGVRTYKLAGLYDRYYEYADLLATQGMLELAAKYVRMTPSDYKGTGAAGFELDKARDRLLRAADSSAVEVSVQKPKQTAAQVPPSSYQSAPTSSAYATVTPPAPYAAGPAPPDSYTPASTSYKPPAASYNPAQSYGYSDPYAPSQPQQPSAYGPTNGYGPPNPQSQGYGIPSSQSYGASTESQDLVPPPRANAANGSTGTPPPVPASQRRDMPGWNDVPNAPLKRPGSAMRDGAKPAPIMSPFPMSTDPMAGAMGQASQNQGMTPPPARTGQPGMLPPPPRGGPRPPSAQAVARQPSIPPQSQARPPPPTAAFPRQPMGRGGPPPGTLAGPPPKRAHSPLGPQGRVTSPLGQGRVTSPLGHVRPPPAQPARVLSPPSQASPPGSRLAGPPPPGRTPPVTQASPAPSPPRASQPTPAKSAYREYVSKVAADRQHPVTDHASLLLPDPSTSPFPPS